MSEFEDDDQPIRPNGVKDYGSETWVLLGPDGRSAQTLGQGSRPLTLAEFLLARISEDIALMHNEGLLAAWHTRDCGINGAGLEEVWCSCEVPARVLAECEAKRRIVEVAERFGTWEGGMADVTLRYLALPYADHPDYRDEWKV